MYLITASVLVKIPRVNFKPEIRIFPQNYKNFDVASCCADRKIEKMANCDETLAVLVGCFAIFLSCLAEFLPGGIFWVKPTHPLSSGFQRQLSLRPKNG